MREALICYINSVTSLSRLVIMGDGVGILRVGPRPEVGSNPTSSTCSLMPRKRSAIVTESMNTGNGETAELERAKSIKPIRQ